MVFTIDPNQKQINREFWENLQRDADTERCLSVV